MGKSAPELGSSTAQGSILDRGRFEESPSREESDQKIDGCMFCHPAPESVIISETQSCLLIRDNYPIVEGHRMIVSKNHLGCLGEIPKSVFPEIESLKKIALDDNDSEGRQTILYEHGRAGHCVKIAESEVVCHHFHLHLLPASVDITPRLRGRFFQIPFRVLSEVAGLYEKYSQYLLFVDANRMGYFYVVDEEIESHLLRTLICEELGLTSRADWEKLEAIDFR